MAGFLSKFVRGAANAGATLLADQANQNQRAEIVAKRDAVLEANRVTRETSKRAYDKGLLDESRGYNKGILEDKQAFSSEQAQLGRDARTAEGQLNREYKSGEAQLNREFKSGETDDAQSFVSGESEKKRAAAQVKADEKAKADKETPQYKMALLKLESAKDMADLKKQYTAAKDPEERFAIVKEIMAANGRPIEGRKASEKTIGVSLLNSVVKMLKEEQKTNYVFAGDPGYKTTDELLTEANTMVKKVIGIPSAPSTQGNKDLPNIADKAAYDKLPSGAIYINANTGQKGRKP